MPELPEVETIRSHLSKQIIDQPIADVTVFWPKVLNNTAQDYKNALINQRISEITRHGKYLFLWTSNQQILVVHLRMTGQLFLAPKDYIADKHTHLIWKFKNIKELLVFRDLRKFGRWTILAKADYERYIQYKKLGPDALSIAEKEFQANLKKRNKQLKVALLDQSIIAGLGNIYADEILIRAHLHPLRTTGSLTDEELAALYREHKAVLAAAVKAQGTSVSDYIQSYGQKGHFQLLLKAYNQTGKPCAGCGTPIIKIRAAGRGTHVCSKCQIL